MAATNQLLETVLRECQAKSPAPFYPSVDGRDKGLDRAALDRALDELRLGGLLELTPWEAGHGQGYRLTAEGEQVLQSPRLLARLRSHGVQAKPAQPALVRETPVEGEMSTWQRGEQVRSLLLGGVTPYVTMALLMANLFIFFLGMSIAVANNIAVSSYLEGDGQATGELLRAMGSVNRVQVLGAGEWWRLITYQFLHKGLLHLVLNMLFLYNLGRYLEAVWRHWRFAALYLISGIGGGTAVLLTHTAAVGASGSLCGIFASLILFIVWNRDHLPPQFVNGVLRQLFLNAIILIVISNFPGVSGAGHLGGALAGIAVSVPLMYTLFGKGGQRWLGALGVIAVPAVCLALVWNSRTDRDQAALVQEIVVRASMPALNAYHDYGMDLIRRPEVVLTDRDTRVAAQVALADAEENVRNGEERLKKLESWQSGSNKSMVIAARAYLKGYTMLLQACLRRLRDEEDPPAAAAEIIEQAKQVRELRQQLYKSDRAD